MGQQEIKRYDLEMAANEANVDNDEDTLRWEYSGRGMYGRKCPGLVGDVSKLASLFVALTQQAVEYERDDFDYGVVMDLAEDTVEDSMGRQSIFYWPSFKAV